MNNKYLIRALASAHPVIASGLLGICSLITLSNRKFRTYAILICFSLILRESAIIFIASACIVYRQRKVFLASLPALILFIGNYGLHYLQERKLLLNDQALLILNNCGQSFVLNLDHILSFFINRFFYYPHFVFLIVLSLVLVIYKKRCDLFFSHKLISSLLIVSLGHSLFFALYGDTATRDIFMSSASLIIAIGIICFHLLKDSPSVRIILSLAIMILGVSSIIKIHSSKGYFNKIERTATALKEMAQFLTLFRANNPDKNIVAPNPISRYMNNPFLGYVKKPLNLTWYGGFIKTAKLGNPDVLVYIHYSEMNDFVINMHNYGQRENFKPIYQNNIYKKNTLMVYSRE